MPEFISVNDYISEVKDDISSPPTSNFVSKMPLCRQTVNELEEGLDRDREGLAKMKKVVKAMHSTGQDFVASEVDMSDALRKLGDTGGRPEDKALSEAFHKFAVVIREHSQLLQQLITNQKNNLLPPLSSVLKGDLKGVKGDLKQPFEKAAKVYDTRFSKIEKDMKQQAKEAGFFKHEVDAAEIAEEMSKERKMFQLQMCDYLIKVNEIKTKKGVEFLQKLVEYYHAYCKYFEEGMKTWAYFGSYVSELSEKLRDMRHRQEEEKRHLLDTRKMISNSLNAEVKPEAGVAPPVYHLHRAQGNKIHGTTKSGYLSKKSEGKMRKVWQRRRCDIRDSVLFIRHSDETKPPVTVPLLTCQVKRVGDDGRYFDLVSYNRTYHLMAEDEVEADAWVSVLLNSKEGALQKALCDDAPGPSPPDSGFRELQQRIISYVRGLPSNTLCCDCGGTNDVTWLSTNYGVMVCIECSGIHRDLGVHISRIQSLTLDKVGTAQLLLARHMTNKSFNEVTEATAPRKPEPTSTMDERREFIQSKYVRRAFVQPSNASPEELQDHLREVIINNDLSGLLRVYFQGGDLGLPLTALKECALHVAIFQENGSSLPLVDFLVQNSRSLDRQTLEGNTPLHYCVIHNKPECMRLLLRVGANPSIENNNGKTPLDIANERNCRLLEDMLNQAQQQRKSMFENVEYEWNLSDDNCTDMSDDEEIIKPNGMATPEKVVRSRLVSLSGSGSPICQHGSDHHTSSEDHSHSEYRTARCYRAQPPPPPVSSNPTLPRSMTEKRPAPKPPAGVSHNSSFYLPHYSSHSRTPSDPMLGPPTYHPGLTHNNNNGGGGGSLGGIGHKRSPSTDSSNSVFFPQPSSSSNNTTTSSGTTRFSLSHNLPSEATSGSASDGRPLDTDTSPSSSPQESPNTFINGRSTESLSSLVSDDPQPPPRRRMGSLRHRRCKALYDCDADLDDELSFKEGEIIIVLQAETEDGDWMEGEIEGDPKRRGKVPINFVHMFTD
ncbi:arfGAP with SH3 domain, ANK repeat and PH domain-containing protein-like isoform X2 [Portunus trituberculatus]|uniref:arfGAP with SH3 domain, ANK repeat and PH domain-containing protein-like isoform X2 n=1 Tax=Portunus trituberculatus TaxID=210409 RepID=UPI001E1D06F1|nr:arfGAP with SH3 domain, ANK repeat and PH domain-containing protein-like isoform X2 [Portunus trituberculatus]